MNIALKNVFKNLQLIEGQSVFLFKKEDKNTCAYISKETFKKLEIITPDAVYSFNKQPYILFFDLTNTENQIRISEIHKQVWSFDQAPLMIFVKNNVTEYYNAQEFDKKTKALSQILDNNIINKINFWDLQSGETLNYLYNKNKKFNENKRVNQQLFLNIKQTISLLNKELDLDEKIAKTLVLRLIFIRYLIDRNIKIDNLYIEGENVLERKKALSILIANPEKLQAFFDYLNGRFNGVLFKSKETNTNELLNTHQANFLSKLLNPDGVSQREIINLFTGTKFETEFQFEVFDFGIIPVELISGIYETLLDPEIKEATSAIYTPPFLVDYMLTETVDKYFEVHTNTSECKIFDPAMGSGIFLVQGFRRMVERELILNPSPSTDNTIFGDRIKQIAQNNLFGIDINEEAIDVACFSIYVALLDYQQPGDIDVYHFPTLRDTNFFKVHFFDLEKETLLDRIKEEKVDFILGNPPWKSNNSPEHLNWLKQTKFDKIVSDKQIAQSYLIRVNDFSQKNTVIALIVTSKVYYNNKAQKFKKYFLKNNALSEIFDLSSVRHIVFENADNPGTILFFKTKPSRVNNNSEVLIKYTSLKQNKFFNEFTKSLVVEKFDRKEILQKHFYDNKWLFKVALYGNTLDYVLLKKFDETTKTSTVFKASRISFSEGVFRGTPKKYFKELIDLPILRRVEFKNIFTNFRNDFNRITYENSFLEAGRTIDLFKGKKIILQKSISTNVKLSIVNFDCVFDSTVYGINFHYDENRLLEIFTCLLLSDFYIYYQYLTSSSWGAYIPEIYKEEHIDFPYIEPNQTQKQTLISLVDELLKPYKEHYKNSIMEYTNQPNPKILNQINEKINEIYGIKGYEKDLIDYVLNVSRYQFQDSKQHLVSDFSDADHRNKKNVLETYAKVYIQEFEKIYNESYFKVEVYDLNHFIAMEFTVLDGDAKSSNQIEFIKGSDKNLFFNKLSTTSIEAITSCTNAESNLFIQKDIKGFEENSFYIIKPDEYKCWHKAMAWYDVAEFKEAIQKAELERIRLRNE